MPFLRNALAGVMLTVMAGTLAGCASQGGEDKFSQSYVQSHFTIGKSTMQDVQAVYGMPDRRSTQRGTRVYWTYQRNRSGTMGMLGSVARVVPGVGMANSVNQYNDQSQKMQAAADASSGNTDVRGDELQFIFQDGVLDDWSL